MARNWDKYSRQGLDIAHSISSFGFSAAKKTTRLGFAVARGIATTAVGVTTTVLDFTLFGGGPVTKPVFGLAVHTVLTVAERLTLAPIHLSEYITTTSLYAAHSSINVLSIIFPGSSDASFSLASFVDLVRRETSRAGPDLPEGKYGVTQIARALVGWGSLQGVTQQWQEQCWFKHLKEVTVHPHHHHRPSEARLQRKPSRIRVTSDVIFPGEQGPQIISADIGEPQSPATRSRASSIYLTRTRSHLSMHRHRTSNSTLTELVSPAPLNMEELKATLRRLSKMVLAGYGGASLLFFGVSPRAFGPNRSKQKTSFAESVSLSMAGEKSREEAKLANAIDASEAEAAGDDIIEEENDEDKSLQYSWWDVLLGKHDQEIFERSTAHHEDTNAKSKGKARTANVDKGPMKAKAVFGNEHLMPRFWVLTDHSRGQVVLVIRGTMSLNEIAVDLTCEYEEFEPASTPADENDHEHILPGNFPFPRIQEERESTEPKRNTFLVHGGMLRMARLMGEIGKPVQLAVLEALTNNPDFELVLCGHSLGAGVAALLGMLWADSKTCLTVQSSGLPINRPVSVYCFAPPALTDVALSRLCSRLVVSFVYSMDVVSRLSVGTVVNLRNVAMWLCDAQENGDGTEGFSAVTARAKNWKNGKGSADDYQWFIAMRKTLEANMQNLHLYPPGRVLWAMRDGELHPAHQLPGNTDKDKLRLFEVNNVDKIFSQIIFNSNMLTAHLPHQYNRVLHDLL